MFQELHDLGVLVITLAHSMIEVLDSETSRENDAVGPENAGAEQVVAVLQSIQELDCRLEYSVVTVSDSGSQNHSEELVMLIFHLFFSKLTDAKYQTMIMEKGEGSAQVMSKSKYTWLEKATSGCFVLTS
jgi:hypothetical protein